MSYTVLARKYRPETFTDLIGQNWITKALKNAIKNKRVAHAFLFSGPRGVGKTSMARILSKALNCKNGPTDTPCLKCEHCLSISKGNEVDVIEIDAASNRGIDHIRTIRENVRYAPVSGRFKIYIIDEVHMLTMESFNALLKTLEEPPEHVKFIFATTEPQKMPETVRSRCQCYEFRRITTQEIANLLEEIAKKEGIQYEKGVMQRIAVLSRGGLRDAESLLDQISSLGGGKADYESLNALTGRLSPNETADLIDAVINAKTDELLDFVNRVFASGGQGDDLLKDVISYWRELMVLAAGVKENLTESLPELEERRRNQAEKMGLDKILTCLQIAFEALRKGRWFDDDRIITEMALLKMARLSHTLDLLRAYQDLGTRENKSPPVKKKRVEDPKPPESPPITSKSDPKENVLKIFEKVRETSPTLAAYLKKMRFKSFQNNTYEFQIGKDETWGPFDPEGRKVKQELEKACKAVLNQDVKFLIERTLESNQDEIPLIVKKTMDLFDGDMV